MLNLMALKDEIDALTVKRGIGGESGTSVADRVLSQLLRSEEHTSELQSQSNIVCRLLLEKKNSVDVLFEAAHWDPVMVSRTARRHRLLSEAAERWERVVDPHTALVALEKQVPQLTTPAGV